MITNTSETANLELLLYAKKMLQSTYIFCLSAFVRNIIHTNKCLFEREV